MSKASPPLGHPYMVRRFWTKVRKTRGCWRWRGTVGPGGYGFFWLEGKNCYAHRVAYQLVVGPIPEGQTLDHLCRVRLCVNPKHLEPCSLRENILRGTGPSARNAAKKTCKRGHPFNAMTKGKTGRLERRCYTCNRQWYMKHQRALRGITSRYHARPSGRGYGVKAKLATLVKQTELILHEPQP